MAYGIEGGHDLGVVGSGYRAARAAVKTRLEIGHHAGFAA
jgi:hypothetical protein